MLLPRFSGIHWKLTCWRCNAERRARAREGGVPPGADVADVGLPGGEHLGAPEVAQLQHVGRGVHQQVLRTHPSFAAYACLRLCTWLHMMMGFPGRLRPVSIALRTQNELVNARRFDDDR